MQIQIVDMNLLSPFPHHGNGSLNGWQIDTPPTILFRAAAAETGSEGSTDFNFSILSVAVVTLGVLLFVQWARLCLDDFAQQRPLFKAILERVNHELATIGVVEFFIFLLHKYYPNLDAAKEEAFTNVKYTLFLIAIFNAVQSVLIASCASRLSSRLWVETEQVEVDHYVEIREEFDRVDRELYGRRKSPREGASRTNSGEEYLEFAFEWTWRAIRILWTGVVDAFWNPRLVYKHRNLLTKIRFHELRVQLIVERKLPVQMKISDYLKRRELTVFIKLGHISTLAWVMLTGTLTVTYFLMGMVGYVTSDVASIGEALFYTYLFSVVLFVVTTLLVNNKMKRIFNHIIHTGNRQGSSSRPTEEESPLITPESQLKLFWQAEPRLVISLLRFIEVGYSMHLAILAVFWESLGEARWSLLTVLLVCYCVFLLVVARTLPRYTLCTSLGQLVDEERLHETLAHFRLQEAKRKRRQRRDEYENEKRYLTENNDTRTKLTKHLGDSDATFSTRALVRKLSGYTVEQAMPLVDQEETHDQEETDELNKHKLFSELVNKKTSSLRRLVSCATADSSNERTRTEDKRPRRAQCIEMGRESANSSLEVIPDAEMKSFVSLPLLRLPSSQSLETDGEIETTSGDDIHRKSRNNGLSDGSSATPGMSPADEAPKKPERVEGLKAIASRAKSEDGGSSPGKNDLVDDGDAETADKVGLERGESDDDEPPGLSANERIRPPMPPKTPFREKVQSFYLSERFRLISTVAGTLPALFLVGMRVEILLTSSHVIPLAENTFKLLPLSSFWLEASLFILFIITSTFIVVISRPREAENNQDKLAFVNAGLDLLISASCFILLFVAESKRCCAHEHAGRYLASKEVVEEEVQSTAMDCSCPIVGKRTYGGLGNIEPFTCLVTLRIFTFTIASTLVNWLERRRSWDVTDAADEKDVENLGGEPEESHPSIVLKSAKYMKERKKQQEGDAGTVVELWERAIGQYPYIVSKYGEFSSELLQTMLGIDVVDLEASEQPHSVTSAPKEERSAFLGATPSDGIVAESFKRTLNETGYSTLVPAVQAVILAGMLGKSVKSAMKIDEVYGIPESEGSLVNDGAVGSARSPSPSRRGRTRPQLPSRDELPLDGTDSPPEFEIESLEIDPEMDNVIERFDHPSAPLVRNMRRCDRKFLPLLEQWSVVDVVLTKYELVYFDASEADDCTHLDANASVSNKAEAIRQAIIATNGGKGLRLCDVAYGRKVAGRVKLTDCISAHVDRYLPPSTSSREGQVEGDREGNEQAEMVQPEFWKHPGLMVPDVSRNSRWERVKEDHLVVVSVSGTLLLRFYGDLEYSEAHLESDLNENDEPAVSIQKNNALQWCQTIVRYCGIDQLKQKLPHFGDNSVDELCDYLHVIDRPEQNQRRGLGGASMLRHHIRSAAPDISNIVMLLQRVSRRPSNTREKSEDSITNTIPSDRSRHRRQPTTKRSSCLAEVEPRGNSSHHGPSPSRPPKQNKRAISLGAAEWESSDHVGSRGEV